MDNGATEFKEFKKMKLAGDLTDGHGGGETMTSNGRWTSLPTIKLQLENLRLHHIIV